jgi:hypothetical protein
VLDRNGIAICKAPNRQETPAVAFNGNSYLVVWEDWRHSTVSGPDWLNSDLFGAWVSPSGAVSNADGFPICTEPGRQSAPALAANGSDFLRGDLFLVWEDARTSRTTGFNPDLYGTRITSGAEILEPSGFPISAQPLDERAPSVAYAGAGRFLVASQAFRLGTDRTMGNIVSFYEPVVIRNDKTILTFRAEAGKKYRVQFKSHLTDGSWVDMPGDLTATGDAVTKVDDGIGRAASRFYRLIPAQ